MRTSVNAGDLQLLRKWETVGVVFVFLLGALLHFVFEWSGSSPVVGAFASVNESVWEHFKQGYWPMLVWAIAEYAFLPQYRAGIPIAKAAAVYILPVVTGLVFYAYSSIIGREILIVDILIFLAAIIVAQFASYKIISSRRLTASTRWLGIGLIIILGAILVLFTFYPPHLPILLDHNTGMYGIP